MTCLKNEQGNCSSVFEEMKIIYGLEVLLLNFSVHFVIFSEASKDLPGFIPKCSIDDPKLENCLLKATQMLRPYLKSGIPEVGIPALNPLVLPEISLEQGTPSINYKAKLTNVSLYGLDEYKFEYLRLDLDKLQDKIVKLHCKVKFDKIYIKSQYDISGRLLVAPIQGNGIVHFNVTNVECELRQTFALERRNGGRRYINLTDDFNLKLNIEDSIPKYEGLFNGNERIAQLTNQVLLDNSKELIQEITPEIEAVAKKLVTEIEVNVFQSIPFSKIFPKSKKL